jgi:AcrR family transcriptional regulator
MKKSRSYRMTARAESTERTGERILDAATSLFWERPTDELPLHLVAERAGVSVQTVIRRFGSKDGLLAAAVERGAQRVDAQRGEAPAGDLSEAVRVLLDHYEQMGDQVLRMLAEQTRVPGLTPIVEQGRAVHREWCRRVFEPTLAARPAGARRDRLLAQLVAVCDVQTWALLRHQAGLSRRQTEIALAELLTPLLKETR